MTRYVKTKSPSLGDDQLIQVDVYMAVCAAHLTFGNGMKSTSISGFKLGTVNMTMCPLSK